MDYIKRKIWLEDITSRSKTTHGVITGDSFYLKIILTQNCDDMGLFKNFEKVLDGAQNNQFTHINGVDPSIRYLSDDLSRYTTPAVSISALTEERLDDVRNYNENNIYDAGFDIRREDYINYEGDTVFGRTRVTIDSDPIEYIIDAHRDDANIGTPDQDDGFYLKTFSADSRTEIYYKAQGWNETNVGHSGLTKEEYLFGITSEPQVFSDVFIDRGVISPKEKHLKLGEVRTLNDLINYGNGFFNVKK